MDVTEEDETVWPTSFSRLPNSFSHNPLEESTTRSYNLSSFLPVRKENRMIFFSAYTSMWYIPVGMVSVIVVYENIQLPSRSSRTDWKNIMSCVFFTKIDKLWRSLSSTHSLDLSPLYPDTPVDFIDLVGRLLFGWPLAGYEVFLCVSEVTLGLPYPFFQPYVGSVSVPLDCGTYFIKSLQMIRECIYDYLRNKL